MSVSKKIRKYNKKYIRELDIALKVVKPYLIKAFSEFYGKEYEETISLTINKLSFSYFISKKYLEVVKSSNINVDKRYKKVASDYILYLNKLDELENLCLDNLLLKTFLNKRQLDTYISFDILDFPFFTLLKEDYLCYEKYIFLSIFAINLEVIIHEINHALMIDILAIADDNEIIPNLFLNVECEELFNEYIANKVLEQYIELHYPIPYSLKRFQFVNEYVQFFDIIEVFYFVFEQVIKRSIMTKSFNLLWNYAGFEDFKLFCLLVQKYYLNKGCSIEEYDKLMDLVFKMQNHALSIKKIDYETYFRNLENRGYLVRRLK